MIMRLSEGQGVWCTLEHPYYDPVSDGGGEGGAYGNDYIHSLSLCMCAECVLQQPDLLLQADLH